MFAKTRLFAGFAAVAALISAMSFSALWAQDATLEEIKYNEDYDRVQTILKVSDIQKRGDRIIALYKERADMRAELRDYVDKIFARDLEGLMKAQNIALLASLSEKAIKVRPRFGEAYLFQGIALKNGKKNQEAMMAFAKCYVITNPLQKRAKQQLDVLYRAEHGGSLIGQDKLVSQAAKELKSK